jgi:pimeloyl-ACP methyl ester carboxylesterase
LRALFKIILLVIATALLLLVAYIEVNKVPDKPVDELSSRWADGASEFVNIAGMNVHMRDEGPKSDPRPIVLIHGTSASLHTWDGWTEALSSERRVIRFDLPGFGLTGPEPNNNYSIEHYAKFVVSVLDELGISSAVIGGNSLGGYIAWATGVLHPERVTALVLVDPSGYPFESESVPIAFKLSQSKLASTVLKDFLPWSLVKRSVENVYGDPELVTDELVDRYFELSLREGNRDSLKQRFLQTSPGALIDRIHTIKVPTLIIWGGLDRLIPPALGKRFEQDIVNSKLMIFDALGHVPHEENPLATVMAVKDFLKN